jgi:peptidyl-prolyl cis-trans isomerase D
VPPFEQAAFALAPGALSEPVETEFGIHIIKVLEHEQARVKPFEEVQSEINTVLINEKVQNALSGAAEQAAAEWRRAPGDPGAVAAKFKGTVLDPPPIARGDAIPQVPNSEIVSEDIFLLEAGQIGRPVPVPSGYVIPLLESTSPARQGEFAEVRERARTDYTEEKGREQLQAKGLELAQQVEQQASRDLERVARTLGLTAKRTDPVTRNGSIASVGAVRDLGPRLDTIQPGEAAGPIPVAGGQIVFQLVSREAANEADFAAMSEGIRQRLLNEKQMLAFSLFSENLKTRLTESGDIKIDDEVVARMNAAVVR